MLRFPHFLDNRFIDGGKVVSLTLRPSFTPKNHTVAYLVEALCYKPEGRGFKSRWGHWIFFNWPNPSSRTMALGSTQPLTEMNTRNIIISIITKRRRDSTVGIATCYCLDNRGVGVQVPIKSRIFFFPRRPDRLWGSPIQWVPRALSPRVKLPRLVADHSGPTSAEVKNSGAIPAPPIHLHDAVLN
jgi:hypothetical protein